MDYEYGILTNQRWGNSPDFHNVLVSCLDEVFAIFDHHTFVKTLLPNTEPLTSSIQEISNVEALQVDEGKRLTLANLLPTISRQAHLVIAGNEYLNVSDHNKR
jgi:peroxin-3